jgi:hypothetical protein
MACDRGAAPFVGESPAHTQHPSKRLLFAPAPVLKSGRRNHPRLPSAVLLAKF